MTSQMILSQQDKEWFCNWFNWKMKQGKADEIETRKRHDSAFAQWSLDRDFEEIVKE